MGDAVYHLSEVIGAADEYKEMPVASLRQRLFETVERARPATRRKTALEIVAEVNDLARMLLKDAIGTGYLSPDGWEFYRATDARSMKAWRIAVQIYERFTATEVADALSEVLENEHIARAKRARASKEGRADG